MRRKLKLCMFMFLLLGMIFVSKSLKELAVSGKAEIQKDVIVIDPGHGGKDPGKVGVNGALEKEINLQIAIKVKKLLEDKGYYVVMTRESDDSTENKREDMKKRVELINELMPVITVSIHQNSYSDSSVNGAQVFYYTNSKESAEAAQIMQREFQILEPENTRQPKADHTFYMLKNTKGPIIIVECGFLSNEKDAAKLAEDEYQNNLSVTICNGIIKWLDK